MGQNASNQSSHLHTDNSNPSYIPADKDIEFLQRDELRSVRLGLELLKPELIQTEEGIGSTIVVFGSARLKETTLAQQELEKAEAESARSPQDAVCRHNLVIAKRHLDLSKFYEIAREFGRLVSSTLK